MSNYRHALPVTKSDTADIAASYVSDALWIGTPGTGTLSVITEDNQQVDFVGVPVGEFKLAVRRVRSTGTNATNIVALKY